MPDALVVTVFECRHCDFRKVYTQNPPGVVFHPCRPAWTRRPAVLEYLKLPDEALEEQRTKWFTDYFPPPKPKGDTP